MKKGISPVLLLGGAAAAYLLLSPSGGGAAASSLAALIPGQAPAAQPVYGVNSGLRGGNGSFFTCSNYAQLLAIVPNLGNPNYQMTAAENAQYLANYLDLQQGLQTWNGQKTPNGGTVQNIAQAAQLHWTMYGCAEKRIFLPLQPPSNGAYIPPPPAKKSSGSGIFGTLLKAATIVAGGVITVATGGAAAPLVAAGESAALTAESAIHGPTDMLNDAEVQLLFQGAAILYDILPLYQDGDPVLTQAIKLKLDELLKEYA